MPEYEGPKDPDFEMVLGHEVITECPISLIENSSVLMWNLFWNCHSVIGGDVVQTCLPEKGGALNQDNYTMQAFNVIASEQRKIYTEQLKKV